MIYALVLIVAIIACYALGVVLVYVEKVPEIDTTCPKCGRCVPCDRCVCCENQKSKARK